MSMYVDVKGNTIMNLYVDSKLTINPEYVLSVQVDGHELEKALAITGRPYYKRVMRFYGDDAKMIVGNW